MNNQTYSERISKYIKNYDSAVEKINNVKSNLDTLYNSFSKASGNDITLIKNEIEELISDNESFKKLVIEKKNQTISNASKYDDVYLKWKNKIGKVVKVAYYYDGSSVSENYKIAIIAGKSPFYEKHTEIIDNVGIGNDGCVNVNNKITVEKYQINVAPGHVHEAGTISFLCRYNYRVSTLTGYRIDTYNLEDKRIKIGAINFTGLN